MSAFPVSSFAEGQVVDKEYCCTICEEQNTQINAVCYCKKCKKFFCGQCIQSHRKHVLFFNKQSPYGSDKMMKWPLSKKVENYLITCDIHKEEKLTMFCQDHSRLCCSKCVYLDHSLCPHVKVLSEVKMQSSDVKKLSDRISKTLSRIKKLQRYREDNRKSMRGSYAEIERNMVGTLRLKIQALLVQYEETYEQEYTENEIRQKLKLFLAEFENSSIKEMKAELTLKQAPVVSVINTCIRHQTEVLRLSEVMRKVKDQPELSLMARYKCQDKIQQSEIYMNENFPDEVFSVHEMSKHKVRISSDSNKCWIFGVCVLPNGQTVVVDNNNYKIKLLNEQCKVVSHWGVTAWPHDICLITPSEVAVAVDDRVNTHEVQFITVLQEKLVPGRKLQFQHPCHGYAHHKGELFICADTALYKYSISGQRLCVLYEDTSVDVTGKKNEGYILIASEYALQAKVKLHILFISIDSQFKNEKKVFLLSQHDMSIKRN